MHICSKIIKNRNKGNRIFNHIVFALLSNPFGLKADRGNFKNNISRHFYFLSRVNSCMLYKPYLLSHYRVADSIGVRRSTRLLKLIYNFRKLRIENRAIKNLMYSYRKNALMKVYYKLSNPSHLERIPINMFGYTEHLNALKTCADLCINVSTGSKAIVQTENWNTLDPKWSNFDILVTFTEDGQV